MIFGESELGSLKQIYGDDNVRVKAARERIGVLQRELSKMGGSAADADDPVELSKDELYPPLRRLPELGVRYANLYRRVKVQEAVYELLSTPKQERFMAHYIDRLQVPLLVGVGAAFDYHTGRICDSPEWVKRAGLQWLHRLVQDPKRLWKRYLQSNPAFIWNIALQVLKVRHYPHSSEATTSEAQR